MSFSQKMDRVYSIAPGNFYLASHKNGETAKVQNTQAKSIQQINTNEKIYPTIVFAIDECQVCFTRRGAFVNCSQCSSMKGIISWKTVMHRRSDCCVNQLTNSINYSPKTNIMSC